MARSDWRLRISGLVREPDTLTFADLTEMEPVGITADFQCVTGWRVDDVPWKGVRLADVWLSRKDVSAACAGGAAG